MWRVNKKQARSARIAEQTVAKNGADITPASRTSSSRGQTLLDVIVHYASRHELEAEAEAVAEVVAAHPPLKSQLEAESKPQLPAEAADPGRLS